MMRALKKLGALLVRNFWWKLLSLAIATVLWAVVWSEPELSTFPVVPVEYKNLPDDMEFSAEPVSSVKLELRGPSGELSGMMGAGVAHPQVILDLSSVTPGHRTFQVGDGNVKLPRGVRMAGSIPSQIRLEFDRRLERKVPVEVRISGTPQHGYTVAREEADPKELTIVGPAGRVGAVRSALTDSVDVSTLVGTFRSRVNAFVQDPYVRFESEPQVTVTITMKR
ncbi:MAG TPA: CdaR family protein [Bryobacteraceae bacterium]|nr:CdaR family protein [Bryobacteraceae bacterium]